MTDVLLGYVDDAEMFRDKAGRQRRDSSSSVDETWSDLLQAMVVLGTVLAVDAWRLIAAQVPALSRALMVVCRREAVENWRPAFAKFALLYVVNRTTNGSLPDHLLRGVAS